MIELWAPHHWSSGSGQPYASVCTVDAAVHEATRLSRELGMWIVAVDRSTIGKPRTRGVAERGAWRWGVDCALCKGANAMACVRCRGAGWKAAA